MDYKGTDIIDFEPVNENSLRKKRLKKIGRVDAIVAQIPNMVASKQLSGAYKIVMPSNASGDLIRYKDGLLGTVVKDNSKITGHAGLKSISGVVSPMLVFTALSVITGQYFLAEINQNIKKVLSAIDDLEALIFLKEESVLFSHKLFLERVLSNYSYISGSQSLKMATLCNIQKTINELSSSFYFYAKASKNKLSKIKEALFKEELKSGNLEKLLKQIKISGELRNIFILLEFSLTQSFDQATIDFIKTQIDKGNRENFKLISEILDELKDLQKRLKEKANTSSKQKRLSKFLNELKGMDIGINQNYIEHANFQVNSAFVKLVEINDQGVAYYVLKDGVYVEH